MPGTVTFTYDPGPGPLKRVLVDWTSDASGDASGTTAAKVVGRLVKATTDPSATAPTDDYDITLKDDEGVDVLAKCESNLTNRDTATTEEQYFFVKDAGGTPAALAVHPAVCSTLQVIVANAGNAKSGQLILFVEGELVGNF